MSEGCKCQFKQPCFRVNSLNWVTIVGVSCKQHILEWRSEDEAVSLLTVVTITYSLSFSLIHYYTNRHTQRSLINWLLKLACACLSFDFIGTSTDESGDDLTTVQIPTSWRSTFLEYSTMQLFFNLFHSLSSELAAMVRVLLV